MKAIQFPYPAGVFLPVETSSVVSSVIIQHLLTGRYERVMRPNFGAGLYDVVFSGASESEIRDLVLFGANEAVFLNKLPVRIVSVDVKKEENRVYITLVYEFRGETERIEFGL